MFKIISIMFAALALLPFAAAQAQDNPTIAILRFGDLPTYDVTEGALLDVLEAYGFISAEENAILHTRQDLQGENMRVVFGSANFDLPTASLMLENALDYEPDALVTLTTTVTQMAVNATSDLESPPAIFFSSVYDPYEAGIAQSPCLKPDHVMGAISTTPYDDILYLMLEHYPEIERIATIFDSAESAGVAGAAEIKRMGEILGLTVLDTAVAGVDGVLLAANSLIDRGAQAFVMPIDLRMDAAGLPQIINLGSEYGIPVFHPALFSIESGATLSFGFYNFYAQGENLGRMLGAHLNGRLDIAQTGLIVQSSEAIGVNLDMAAEQGIEISQEILEQADAVIEAGETTLSELAQYETRTDAALPVADRLLGDEEFLAFLATQVCTPERIAAEQAELNERV
ncbi:MAG: ABC transporter substrate binding protein [Chloroflexi bacterium]|nr:ABC transporter substrate binding protein [Chloroflexota bacterium]MCY4246820.1 ABC transporter substrate binding protein [Chloroflexota bacterium]